MEAPLQQIGKSAGDGRCRLHAYGILNLAQSASTVPSFDFRQR